MFETGLYNKFVVLIMFKRSAMEKLILVVICSVPAQSNDQRLLKNFSVIATGLEQIFNPKEFMLTVLGNSHSYGNQHRIQHFDTHYIYNAFELSRLGTHHI